MRKKLIEELKWRNILNNITNEDKLDYIIENKKGAYIGFDPSASSLHLGNYAAIMLLRRFRSYGIKTYAVVGGATGMIGDPSGKKSERQLLDMKIVEHNKKSISEQLLKYANVEKIIDNYDHYKDMNILEFLRIVGKYINVNYLLEKDIIKSRLETGISYTEFTYTLIQAYDFLKLYKEYDIYLQAGGSDQWGNITTGCEMIRKNVGDNNYGCGLTLNLLLKSDGTKFGKSEKGAIFLDKKLTSPYEMYQFLINQEDNDVINLLKFLTEIDELEINNLEKNTKENPREKLAQKTLAKTITTNIHGENAYNEAVMISESLFKGDILSLTKSQIEQTLNSIPLINLKNNEMTLVEFLVKSNIVSSNRESREMIDNNSISVNGSKETDQNKIISKELSSIHNEYTIIKKGKRNYFIVKWE